MNFIESHFLKLVRQRHSIRKFTEKKVEKEKIITCIEAARLAPSAENIQPWRFIVMDKPELIKEFGENAFTGIYKYTRWAGKAPVLIAICVDTNFIVHKVGRQIQGLQYSLIDIGITGEHIILQAQELGLGTCWIGWFNPRKAKKVLNVPRSWKLVELIAMGYPQDYNRRERKKKSLNEILYFNQYKKQNDVDLV